MEQLPEELILKIFRCLSLTDLINLSKVSSRFKDIIRASKKLWKYDIKFVQRGKIESEKRSYFSNLTVSCFNKRSHQPALDICGLYITRVVFEGKADSNVGSEIALSDIAWILQECPKVQHVKFENLATWPQFLKQSQKPHNVDIIVELVHSSACILDLFLLSKVTALWIKPKEGEYDTGIRAFLRSQPDLKTIVCQGRKVFDLFFSMGNSFSENFQTLPFKLKIFSMRDVFFKHHYIDILAPSASSLTYLTIDDVEPWDLHEKIAVFISQCTNLEELKLKNFTYNSLRPPQSLKRVTLSDYISRPHWISGLENLSTLTIVNQIHSGLLNFEMDYNFPSNLKLNSLSITTSLINSQLNIPHVKLLKLKKISRTSQITRNQDLIINVSNVEDVTVEDCGRLTDQILKELGRKTRNLETLIVSGGYATLETVNNLKASCLNLKTFLMSNIIHENIDG